ncbi:mannose-1-phosphate guanylyltransferase [Candidatus Dependentiae bacterium]|nr:mannose-1-phosphate guanylyltransferase [Candidatus Dependentiae bacterium]
MQIVCADQLPTDSKNVYAVILAGGSGERLWPLSRLQFPKQLLSLEEQKTFLDQAIERVSTFIPTSHIMVNTTRNHAERISHAVGDRVSDIIIEPGARNTGPAILYCCLRLHQKDPDAVVVFLPADHYIPVSTKFVEFLEHAITYAMHHDRMVLLGLQPRYPATGYGYIEYDPVLVSKYNGVVPVKKFHEKPAYDVAQAYVTAGNMLWNAGIFCAKVSVFLDEFRIHAPEMYQGVSNSLHDIDCYHQVMSESVDYAIMEKSGRISVLPADFPWCDIGNVEIFLSLKEQKRSTSRRVIAYESQNSLVDVPDRLVALVGVDDLCVVDTGEILLVAKRQEAEKVKMIVQTLKDMKAYEYL